MTTRTKFGLVKRQLRTLANGARVVVDEAVNIPETWEKAEDAQDFLEDLMILRDDAATLSRQVVTVIDQLRAWKREQDGPRYGDGTDQGKRCEQCGAGPGQNHDCGKG